MEEEGAQRTTGQPKDLLVHGWWGKEASISTSLRLVMGEKNQNWAHHSENKQTGVPITCPTRNHEVAGWIPGLAKGAKEGLQ